MESAQAALELEFIKLLFKVRNKIQNYFKTFKHFFVKSSANVVDFSEEILYVISSKL